MIPPSIFKNRTGIVWFFLLIWTLSCSLIIFGCGGGSSGGSGGSSGTAGSGSLNYSGLTTPAVITSANAKTIAANALETRSTMEGFVGISSLSDTGEAFEVSYQPYLAGVSQAMKESMAQIDYSAAPDRDIPSALETHSKLINGTCGGNASFTIQADTDTGDFSGQMAFNGFCVEGVSISGPTIFSGTANLNTGEFESFTLNFDYVTATSQTESYTMGGSIEFLLGGTTSIATMNMAVQDNNLDRICKVEDYQLVITDGYGQTELEIGGRFYDPDFGYVDLETESLLSINSGDAHPSTGVVILTGEFGAAGGATKIRLTALAPTQCQVESDTNGDGTYDYDTGPMSWADLDNSV